MSDELLAACVADRRLSAAHAEGRRRFTVARDEALVRLRTRQARDWGWTARLLRAARAASHEASVRVESSTEGEVAVTELHFAVPGASLEELELSGLLYAALEPDRGGTPGEPSIRTTERIRRLLGAGLNGALARDPPWVELRTEVGSRRWERTSSAGARIDPYVERLVGHRSHGGRWAVRVASPSSGWAGALGALFSPPDAPPDVLDELWHEVLLGADPEENVRDGLSLATRPLGEIVELGSHATWGRAPEVDGVWLVRDAVRIRPLDDRLAAAGLETTALHGWIDCPDLRLTVDEGDVVDDEAFETLVAWLLDATSHRTADGSVRWTDDEPRLQTAGGAEVPSSRIERQDDVLFVWRHRADDVPAPLRGRVLALWPSEHHWLRRHRPTLRLVPLGALGAATTARPADLTDLAQGSFEPVGVRVGAFVTDDETMQLAVRAYVHRHAAAVRGVVIVLAYGRRIGFSSDPKDVLPGLTIVLEIVDVDSAVLQVDALRDDPDRLRRLVRHAIDGVRADTDALVEAVLEAVGPEAAWNVPYVHARLMEASAFSLGLRYGEAGDHPLLCWPGSALGRIVIGRTLEGDPRTLEDACRRARDVGGVVVTDPARRWRTLESSEPSHRPWILSEDGHALLERTLGRQVLWLMPVVAEAQPHVAPVRSQPMLRLSSAEVRRLRQRAPSDPMARASLLAHALASRADGRPEPEIEELPLLCHWDPRALTPARFVSLLAMRRSAVPPGLVPLGAVARSLEQPVLQVPPALAALLAEVERWRAAARPRHPDHVVGGTARAGDERVPIRRDGRHAEPLVRVAVADRLAAGALYLESTPRREGIALWARGLRVGDFRLPTPLRLVTGRLWLTDAGIMAGHAGAHAVALDHGLRLARAADRARLLSPPGSARRRALEGFLAACREAVARGRDRAGVAQVLGWRAPQLASSSVSALPAGLDRDLALVVRHALEQPVMVEPALLSRSPARIDDPQAWPWVIRVGRRHGWIRRALGEDATDEEVRRAACLVVAETIRRSGGGGPRLDRALSRILAGCRLRSRDLD